MEDEPIGPLEDPAFRELLHQAQRDRVTGLVAHAVSEGIFLVDDDQFVQVAEAHRGAMAVTLVLEQMLTRVDDWFGAAEIEHVVLKGPAVAHAVYPDPSLRDFGDLDLLVPADQIDRAVALLSDRGAKRQLAALTPGWDRYFAKSITMTDGSGYEIDLHRTIAPGVFGLRIDAAVLIANTQSFTVGGRECRALSPEGQLLQACIHTAAGNRRVWLSSICDIVQLARSGKVDLTTFRSWVTDWGLEAAIEQAVNVTRERLDGADVSWLGEGLAVTDADRRRLAQYSGGFSGPALTGFAALPVIRWPRYARALAWPSAANLRDRGLTRKAHLHRLSTYLRHRR